MTENTQPTEITFKDKKYKVADLSDKAKVCYNHLIDLGRKAHNLTFQLDQILAAQAAITKQMEEEVK